MRRMLPFVLALASLTGAGCSTVSNALDTINPFAPSAPKMAELTDLGPEAKAVSVRWSIDVGESESYNFQPAIDGESIFAASHEGVLYRIDQGKVTWKVDVGQPLSSGVGVGAGMVVVGTAKGGVLAFDAGTGNPRWQAQVSSEVLAAPVVGAEGVAVRSGDNRIFFLDIADGSRKWLYQRPLPVLSVRATGMPVFADRYLFAGFPGGKLVGLSLQNGAPVWEGTVAQPRGATELDRVADVVAAPVVDGTQICAVAFQGKVACFDMSQGGVMVWSRDISSARGLALDGRYLFVTDDDGIVYGLDRLSGGSLWKQDKLRNRGVTAPAVRGDVVAVADSEGYVHFLSREEGAFVARGKTDGSPVRAAPQRFGEAILTQTTGGEVGLIEVQ